MKYPFDIGAKYSRRDIFKIIGIPEDTMGGNWYTGYNKHGDDWLIFVNGGIPGRTGHNYHNEFIGDDLLWRGKTGSHIRQPTIESMINPSGDIYIFTRTNHTDPFIFSGFGRVKRYQDTIPVEVLWSFEKTEVVSIELLPEEVPATDDIYEGARKKISVNAHERHPIAKQRCVEYYGYACIVCGFDFEEAYGRLGVEYIHVHHLTPLSEINEEYIIDPIKDLRPICPNCHAMIHRRKPPYSIEDVQNSLK